MKKYNQKKIILIIYHIFINQKSIYFFNKLSDSFNRYLCLLYINSGSGWRFVINI